MNRHFFGLNFGKIWKNPHFKTRSIVLIRLNANRRVEKAFKVHPNSADYISGKCLVWLRLPRKLCSRKISTIFEQFSQYRRKRPKVDASIFDSALSHTRRSDASEKREEKSVSTFGHFRLWTSFESSPVSVKI